jgi:ADP-heptose:LPS heptosyltransferase
MAKMGDMVATTPMFRAIKNKYPNARILVMGNAVNKQLLAGNPDVSEYIVYDKKNFWGILRQIRGLHLDVGILTGPSPEFLGMLYLSGAPLVVAPYIEGGFCPHETRVYKILRKLVETRPHRMGHYAPREYLRLLEPMGIFTEETTKHLRFDSDTGTPHLNPLPIGRQVPPLREGGKLLVGIAPGTGHKIKLWPSERFARLADEICKKYNAKIVIIGGPGDQKEVEVVLSNFRKSDFRKFADASNLSINELKALISKLDLFISVDTGPIYIAEAFGVPTVCIVGPMDEREQPPRGGRHKVVVAPREKPELHIMNNAVFNAREARRQVEDITVEMVMESVDALMKNVKIKNQNDK